MHPYMVYFIIFLQSIYFYLHLLFSANLVKLLSSHDASKGARAPKAWKSAVLTKSDGKKHRRYSEMSWDTWNWRYLEKAMNAQTEHDRTCGIWFQSVVISKRHLPFRQSEGTERTIRQSNGAEHGACPFAAERDVESWEPPLHKHHIPVRRAWPAKRQRQQPRQQGICKACSTTHLFIPDQNCPKNFVLPRSVPSLVFPTSISDQIWGHGDIERDIATLRRLHCLATIGATKALVLHSDLAWTTRLRFLKTVLQILCQAGKQNSISINNLYNEKNPTRSWNTCFWLTGFPNDWANMGKLLRCSWKNFSLDALRHIESLGHLSLCPI